MTYHAMGKKSEEAARPRAHVMLPDSSDDSLVGWKAVRSPRRNPWPLGRARPKLDSGWNSFCWHRFWILIFQGNQSESCLLPLLSLGLPGPPSSTFYTHPCHTHSCYTHSRDSFPENFSASPHLCFSTVWIGALWKSCKSFLKN